MSEEKKILAGPYLLAPAEDEMTVAWEMPVTCDAEQAVCMCAGGFQEGTAIQ